MAVVVVTPSGEKQFVGEVPFQEEASLTFEAHETGLYRIPFDCGANKVAMTRSNRPLCASGETGRIALIGTTGDFYFHVPAKTQEFGVRIAGEGDAEAVAAKIGDPAGNVVWQRSKITTVEQFVAQPDDSQTGKTWHIVLAKPTDAAMEDFYVQLQNIPPFLAPMPEGALKPSN